MDLYASDDPPPLPFSYPSSFLQELEARRPTTAAVVMHAVNGAMHYFCFVFQ
jgi:hypothetical protein